MLRAFFRSLLVSRVEQAPSYEPLRRDRWGFCGGCDAPEDRFCYPGCRRIDVWDWRDR